MVLVDTTVWIDFFAGKDTAEVLTLGQLVWRREKICVCGVILTEVLQGIRKDKEFSRTLSRFEPFIYLPMYRSTFVMAADLYRRLRRKGITIRKPIDCMIAAVAMEHDIALLHKDRDFDLIARHGGLKVVEAHR